MDTQVLDQQGPDLQQQQSMPLSIHQQHLLNLTTAPKRTASGSIRSRTASASAIPTSLGHSTLGPQPGTASPDLRFPLTSPIGPIPPDVAPHIHALRKFDLDVVFSWLHLDRQLVSFQLPPEGPPAWAFEPVQVGMPQPIPIGRPSGLGMQQHHQAPPPFLGAQRPPMTGRPPPGGKQESEKKQRYVCTSCEVRFTRRWDWKHHEETVHERWRKFPCPDCNQEFWSENSFNQHHKSAHNCKNCPHASVVKKDLQKRAAWGCGFCAAVHYSWDDRCKHVASHFDKGQTKDDWKHSNVIYGLLHQPDLLDSWRSVLVEKHGENPAVRPQFNWKSKATGRLQGMQNGSSSKQLQDMLEYARPTQEVLRIIETAYRMGIMDSAPPAYRLERRDSSFPLELASSPPPTPAAPFSDRPAKRTQSPATRAMVMAESSSLSPHLPVAHHVHMHGRPVSMPMMAKTNSGTGSDSGMSTTTFSASNLLADRLESLTAVDPLDVGSHRGSIGDGNLGMFYSSGPMHPHMAHMGHGQRHDGVDFGDVGPTDLLSGTQIFSGPNSLGVNHGNMSSLSLPASLEHGSWTTTPANNVNPSILDFTHSPAFAPGVESLIALEKELPVLGDDYGLIGPSGSVMANLSDDWVSTVPSTAFSSSPDSFHGRLTSST